MATTFGPPSLAVTAANAMLGHRCHGHLGPFEPVYPHDKRTSRTASASRRTTTQLPTVALATPRVIDLNRVATRREHDLLGERRHSGGGLLGHPYFARGREFSDHRRSDRAFSRVCAALALVKQAAARANRRLGQLAAAKADAIDRACDLIAKDRTFLDQFVVDAVQGGAGTSTNMNANEVIANLALELIGRPRGDYAALHPIDDVNMAQSTNDAYPTALRLAVIFATASLAQALQDLAFAFKAKAVEFGDVLKIGRTQFRTRCR